MAKEQEFALWAHINNQSGCHHQPGELNSTATLLYNLITIDFASFTN